MLIEGKQSLVHVIVVASTFWIPTYKGTVATRVRGPVCFMKREELNFECCE